ncbi:redox-sensing transcriptional repressor Rex [Myxococcota bacterium]|nr:redox-sensing transcriptional repressor Rex [Myxococcota bacterium]MBU1433123.1 redox-sensing transcriptional repressor Rex [Myxococcota bacterium]MBU1900721.1 redox-sensing transcriptional repressor Rex [Myxococcota bacterium]
MADHRSVPEPTLRRLPCYIHVLKKVEQLGRQSVSTSDISRELKLDPTQVRKDLSYTGIVGKPRVGYPLKDLIEAIEHFLGWDECTHACLVGVGHLGKALLGYNRFGEYGVRIVAAFDVDEAVVGARISDHIVYHIDALPEIAQRFNIEMGILTTPASAARGASQNMVEAGIKAIWNFAPTALELGADIIVENAQLYATLAVLSRQMRGRVQAQPKPSPLRITPGAEQMGPEP